VNACLVLVAGQGSLAGIQVTDDLYA
jgi:hypothetical protein